PATVGISYTLGGQHHEYRFKRHEPIRTPHFSCLLTTRSESGLSSEGVPLTLYMRFNSDAQRLARYGRRIRIQIADANAKSVEIRVENENALLARDIAQAVAETFISYDVE